MIYLCLIVLIIILSIFINYKYNDNVENMYVKHKIDKNCTPNSDIGDGELPKPIVLPEWLMKPGYIVTLTNQMTLQDLVINNGKAFTQASNINNNNQFKIVMIKDNKIVLQNITNNECLITFGSNPNQFSNGGIVGTFPNRCSGVLSQDLWTVELVSCENKNYVRLINNLGNEALIVYGDGSIPIPSINTVGIYPGRTGCNPQNLWEINIVSYSP